MLISFEAAIFHERTLSASKLLCPTLRLVELSRADFPEEKLLLSLQIERCEDDRRKRKRKVRLCLEYRFCEEEKNPILNNKEGEENFHVRVDARLG